MVMTFDARTNVSRPFGQQLREARRLVGQAVRLAWRASPHLVLGIVVLLALQALLSPLQLALSRALIDSAAATLQLAAVHDPLAARPPRPSKVWRATA
jgi:hypothetical protein